MVTSNTTTTSDRPSGCPTECLRPAGVRHRSEIHDAKRRRVYERDGWQCWLCDRTAGSMEPTIRIVDGEITYQSVTRPTRLSVHHLVAHFHGGCDHEHNLLTLCVSCNSTVGTEGIWLLDLVVEADAYLHGYLLVDA